MKSLPSSEAAQHRKAISSSNMGPTVWRLTGGPESKAVRHNESPGWDSRGGNEGQSRRKGTDGLEEMDKRKRH